MEIFTKLHARAGGGLFTSTNPEIRRVVPDNVNGRTKLKVVYVVLEAQYQSALSAAVRNINATRDKVGTLPPTCVLTSFLHQAFVPAVSILHAFNTRLTA